METECSDQSVHGVKKKGISFAKLSVDSCFTWIDSCDLKCDLSWVYQVQTSVKYIQ
jgi:hypothetical protein